MHSQSLELHYEKKKTTFGVSCVSSRVSEDKAHTPAVDPRAWQSSAPYDMKKHTDVTQILMMRRPAEIHTSV